ncbi:MAG: methyltransferase domain-containing protein [Candidatus Edwardsbacteria bacterium]|nr:methyltransferase domain-containing protein [Candidatus Edwardsbacteria bacterium]
MRPALIEILKCLKCGADDLHLIVKSKDDLEITKGLLSCRRCGLTYLIKDGVLNCLVFADPSISAARRAYRRSKEVLGDTPPEMLARRGHMNSAYRQDTEANCRELLFRLDPGQGWALDVGAGTCWTTAGLAGRGYRAVAIDISADNKLELGCQHFDKDVYFDRVLADVNQLPFNNEVFSLAFASAALHHSRDLDSSLAEISRTMASRARLEIINEPVRGLAEAFQKNTGQLEGPEGIVEKHYGISTWIGSLERSGFKGRCRFPANIRERLTADSFTGRHKFHYLAGFIAKLYKYQWAKFILERILFYFGMHLLGLPLIYSGEKTSAKKTPVVYGKER